MTVGPHAHEFAVNMFARALTQSHKCILATAACISSLTTLEAHSSCHSLLPLAQWMMSGVMTRSQHVISVLLHYHLNQNNANIGFGTCSGTDKQMYSPYTWTVEYPLKLTFQQCVHRKKKERETLGMTFWSDLVRVTKLLSTYPTLW